jgi:hypothetical protein
MAAWFASHTTLVRGDDVVDLLTLGVVVSKLLMIEPFRAVFRPILLKEALAVNAIREPYQGQWSPLDVGQDRRCDAEVVLNQLRFEDAVFWPEHLPQVGQLDFALAHLGHL